MSRGCPVFKAERITTAPMDPTVAQVTRPVVRSMRVCLCTLIFHGYARLRTLTPQHSARLCTLGLGDTEVDILYSHAQILCRKKIGAGGFSV